MAALEKKSLVDQVYEQLRQDIISLRFPFGSKLNVNELQDELGVSTTPIREALNRLQQEGLLHYKNNVGASILTMTAQDISEIQYLASTLHCAAVRLAMESLTPQALAEQLRPHLEAYEKATTPKERVTAIFDFMGVFYHNCGNNRLHDSLRSIQGQQLIVRHLHALIEDDQTKTAQEFSQILDAASQGNMKAVCRLIVANANRVRHLLIAQLEEA